MNLKLLHSVHALQSSEALQGNFGCARHKLEKPGPVGLVEGTKGPPEPVDLGREGREGRGGWREDERERGREREKGGREGGMG